MPRWAQFTVAIAVGVAGLGALYQLLLLQYASGDAYPPYSSYRADPLGTLALHDALRELEGVTVARNLTDLRTAALEPDSTLLLQGAVYGEDPVAVFEKLEGHVTAGNQLAILFRPYTTERPDWEDDFFSSREEAGSDDEAAEGESGNEAGDEAAPDMLDVLNPTEDISERWGFGYGFEQVPVENGEIQPLTVQRGPGALPSLPESLPWYSGMYFRDVSFDWNVVYTRDGKPVMIERNWNGGRIVLATDTYLVSNEALMRHRVPALLAWLFRGAPKVVFEESHLGVVKRPGIMSLLIKYKLVPILVVVVLIALLFIWRNAASLVPRYERTASDHETADSTVGGMANLVRRAVPPSQLLATCWKLYATPVMHHRAPDDETAAAVAPLVAPNTLGNRKKQEIIHAYNRVATVLNERKSIR